MKQNLSFLTYLLCLGACIYAGEVPSSVLMDGFVSYIQKAEKLELDDGKTKEMRKELEAGKDDPLFKPYQFTGDKINRDVIIKSIEIGIGKWKSSEIVLSKSAMYASDPKNVKELLDGELIIADRLIQQVVNANR